MNAFQHMAMKCLYSDTAENDVLQLSPRAVQAFSLMNQEHVSISNWMADA